jgi:hypothetical protein
VKASCCEQTTLKDLEKSQRLGISICKQTTMNEQRKEI